MKISGVDSASISKVSGIAKASIGKFSGVELGGEVNTTIANNTYFTPDHYYDFKGDANDQVGSADGTVYGATYVENGLVDGSYDLDGSNDYIEFPQEVFNWQGQSAFSIGLTVKVDTTSTFAGLLIIGSNTYPSYLLFRFNNNQVYSQFYRDNNTNYLIKAESLNNTDTVYRIIVRGNGVGHEIWVNNTRIAYNASQSESRPDFAAGKKIFLGTNTNSSDVPLAWWLNGKVSAFWSASECVSDDFIEWDWNEGNLRPGGYR